MPTFRQAREFLLANRTRLRQGRGRLPMARSRAVQLGARLVRRGAGARGRQQGPLRPLDRRRGDGPGDQAHLRPVVRALEPGRQLSAPAGAQARRPSPARPQQRGAAVGDHAGRHEAGRRGDSGDDAAHRRGAGRPRRARPRAHDRGRPGPGRQMRRPVARRRGVHHDELVADRRLAAARRCLQGLRRSSRRTARPTPTIRCCSISPRAPPPSPSWCGTAIAATPWARCRPCTGWA